MDTNVQQFFLINAVILLIVVGYILYRPKRHGMKISLRTGNKSINASGQDGDSLLSPEKELNVIFQFNGHSFDAHEVLGLVAGECLENVDKAYARLKESADRESLELYEFAYKSILKKFKS